jgi:predicted dienelactone hydrolase
MMKGRQRRGRRLLAILFAFSLVVLGSVAGYLSYITLRHDRPLSLPVPTGGFSVGRVSFEWTDESRPDPLTAGPSMPRELTVWLWYPAPKGAAGDPASYAPGLWRQLHLGGLPGLGQTRFDAIRTHSLEGAPVAGGRFPVVVLEPGLGFSVPQYTVMAEDLASHGFLVAGVTPTYSANITVIRGRALHATEAGNPPAFETYDIPAATAAGDRLVRIWAADAQFTASQVARLDLSGRFAHHVDRSRTAYIGHSFGGAASLEACRTDQHCLGAADIDGTPYGPVARSGLQRPMLLIGSEDPCMPPDCEPTNPIDRADQAAIRSLLAASGSAAWFYRIRGALHFNFSDYAVYYLAAPLHRLLGLGQIDGRRGLAITNAYLVAFLDRYARGGSESLLAAAPSPYPEVRPQRTR